MRRSDGNQDDARDRYPVANHQFTEIEVLADDDPVFRDGESRQSTIGGAFEQRLSDFDIVPSLTQRFGNRSRAAFIDQEAHSYSAACVQWLRIWSAA